jgi:hypothetical protein
LFLDTDMSRVPDDLSSLAEVWYLDGSSIYHNNNLGKKLLEKIMPDTVSCVPNMAVFVVFTLYGVQDQVNSVIVPCVIR